MAEQGELAMWCSHPVYGRYWQHYQQAMGWMQRHRRAYRTALTAAYGTAPYRARPASPTRSAGRHSGGGVRGRQAEPPRRGHGGQVGDDEMESGSETEEEEEDEEESEFEYDVSNMDISEELRQYFAQTERHREELKRQQQMEDEQQGGYVLADQDLHGVRGRSALPPAERPGERRSAEMRKLYGTDAAKIQSMETALQLTFDRNCDRKRPKYWPVIPLNL